MIELFKVGFLSVGLLDIIDILIVSFLFYKLYNVLKETFAVQVLFGLVVLILARFVTEAINLKSLNWILATVSDVWLLTFVILFQTELRKLLLLTTKSKVFRFFVKSKISETFEILIDSILILSEKHWGALIVLPKSQDVKMTIESGVPLQALVSQELIISIFNPKSPLHDGAIVIENKTVIAARCVLPLSNEKKMYGKNLGTRHRAAVGLTEKLDAVVLIVSEETGNVSIAERGDIRLNINKDNLKDILNEIFFESEISNN